MSELLRRLKQRATVYRAYKRNFDAVLLEDAVAELEQLAIDVDRVIDWLGTIATLEDMERLAVTIKQRCAELNAELEGSKIQ